MPASLELVKIALKAYGSGDCEIALALADPLIRWDERASRADGELVWGHDDVQRAMRRYLDEWDTYIFELEDIEPFKGSEGNGFKMRDYVILSMDRVGGDVTILREKDVRLLAMDRDGKLYFGDKAHLWQYTP